MYKNNSDQKKKLKKKQKQKKPSELIIMFITWCNKHDMYLYKMCCFGGFFFVNSI